MVVSRFFRRYGSPPPESQSAVLTHPWPQGRHPHHETRGAAHSFSTSFGVCRPNAGSGPTEGARFCPGMGFAMTDPGRHRQHAPKDDGLRHPGTPEFRHYSCPRLQNMCGGDGGPTRHSSRNVPAQSPCGAPFTKPEVACGGASCSQCGSTALHVPFSFATADCGVHPGVYGHFEGGDGDHSYNTDRRPFRGCCGMFASE